VTERDERERGAMENKLGRTTRGGRGRGRGEREREKLLSMDRTDGLIPPPLNPNLGLNDDLGCSSTVSPLQQGHHFPSSFSSLLRRSDRKDGNDDDRGSDDGWFGGLSVLSSPGEKEGRKSRGGGSGGSGGVGSRGGEGERRSRGSTNDGGFRGDVSLDLLEAGSRRPPPSGSGSSSERHPGSGVDGRLAVDRDRGRHRRSSLWDGKDFDPWDDQTEVASVLAMNISEGGDGGRSSAGSFLGSVILVRVGRRGSSTVGFGEVAREDDLGPRSSCERRRSEVRVSGEGRDDSRGLI